MTPEGSFEIIQLQREKSYLPLCFYFLFTYNNGIIDFSNVGFQLHFHFKTAALGIRSP